MWGIISGVYANAYFGKAPLVAVKGTVGPNVKAMKFVAVADFLVLISWLYTLVFGAWHWSRVKGVAKSGRMA